MKILVEMECEIEIDNDHDLTEINWVKLVQNAEEWDRCIVLKANPILEE